MGHVGGTVGFVIAIFVCAVLAPVLLLTLPWTLPALMLILCACVIGVALSLVMAPIMGALLGVGVGYSRLPALLFVGVVVTLTGLAWVPAIGAAGIGLYQLNVNINDIRISTIIAVALALIGLLHILLVQLALSGTSYTLAAITYRTAGRSPVEDEARGACAGVNAAMNFLLGIGVIPPYLVMALGPIAGGLLSFAALAAILVASIVPFRRNPATGIVAAGERTAIGWLVCLLPTAWLMEVLGLVLFLTSLAIHGTVGLFVPMMTIGGMRLRSDTGSVIVVGGIAANLNPAPTYNIGTFTFVRTISPAVIPIYNDPLFFAAAASVQNHEIGHQLNLAAFGTAFNLVGFVDEWLGPLIFGGAYSIYGEDLASTNDNSSTPFFPTPLSMWMI
jgi:hypothetical protein